METTNPQGWVCPKCRRVFGPHVAECTYCNNQGTANPLPWPPGYVPFYPYPWPQPWPSPLITYCTTSTAPTGEKRET